MIAVIQRIFHQQVAIILAVFSKRMYQNRSSEDLDSISLIYLSDTNVKCFMSLSCEKFKTK